MIIFYVMESIRSQKMIMAEMKEAKDVGWDLYELGQLKTNS